MSTEQINNSTNSLDPDPNPPLPIALHDVDFPVYTLTDAMMNTTNTVVEMMQDATDAITNGMAIQANLVGPMSSDWANVFQQELTILQGNIASSDPNGTGLAAAQAAFNQANTQASASSTGFSSMSGLVGQQVTSMTSNYQNLAQEGNTVGTGLASFISSCWVL